jgi:hypothetical protein
LVGTPAAAGVGMSLKLVPERQLFVGGCQTIFDPGLVPVAGAGLGLAQVLEQEAGARMEQVQEAGAGIEQEAGAGMD